MFPWFPQPGTISPGAPGGSPQATPWIHSRRVPGGRGLCSLKAKAEFRWGTV